MFWFAYLNDRLQLPVDLGNDLRRRDIGDGFRQDLLVWVRDSAASTRGRKADGMLICHDSAVGEDQAVAAFALAQFPRHLRHGLEHTHTVSKHKGGKGMVG